MKPILLALTLLLSPGLLWAEIHTKVVEYKHGDTVLEGFLAFDASGGGKRPGVLVVHEWTGHNPYARQRAEQLARLGYVAFALDMYGKGVLAKDAAEAAKFAGVYKNDRKLMRARAEAGLDVLRKQPQVDPQRLAAIGYCFGGTTVLELARDGAGLVGIVSFHGDLSTPNPEDAKHIHGKVLVLHGADDPYVPADQVAAFEEEMRKGKVDWQLIKYGDAVHSFTNVGAGKDKSKGAAYNAKADARSWEAMKDLFAEIFPKTGSTSAPTPADVPAKVLAVLKHVDDDGTAPQGYEGGRTFVNAEKHLPRADARGKAITYHEWDVNPHKEGVNRGAERLITGSDGAAYYTDDHYKTFKKIR